MTGPLAQLARSDLETTQELYSRHQITEVLYRWARAVDLRQPAEAATFFTADCLVDYGPRFPQGPLQGRAAYEAYMTESMSDTAFSSDSLSQVRTVRCSHHFSSVQVALTSTTDARVSSRCFSWTEHQTGHTRLHWSAFFDLFTKTDSGWKIRERRNSLARADHRT
jgi:SnoaL-like domain